MTTKQNSNFFLLFCFVSSEIMKNQLPFFNVEKKKSDYSKWKFLFLYSERNFFVRTSQCDAKKTIKSFFKLDQFTSRFLFWFESFRKLIRTTRFEWFSLLNIEHAENFWLPDNREYCWHWVRLWNWPSRVFLFCSMKKQKPVHSIDNNRLSSQYYRTNSTSSSRLNITET